MSAYPDLHDHIRALEEKGLLMRVTRPINKDTEMHPPCLRRSEAIFRSNRIGRRRPSFRLRPAGFRLRCSAATADRLADGSRSAGITMVLCRKQVVRWQFRGGIPESQRRAFLFENVTDSKGRRFDIPVAVGILASNRAIYSTGIGCDVEHIREKWDHAEQHGIEPVLTDNPPCQEIVVTGDALRREGQGVDALPIPISTPGFDNAPYASSSMFVSKDPDTGRQKPFLKL